MKRWRLALAALALACAGAPLANATSFLPALTITAAIGAALTTAPLQFVDAYAVKNLTLQANFMYGSSGTSVDAYVQTSLDGGVTWVDIANFHFTTSSAIKIFNLSSLTPETTAISPSDGGLASNTVQDGVLGPLLRVKYKSSGTYGGGTTLQIDASTGRLELSK